jgi:hypothetical protein
VSEESGNQRPCSNKSQFVTGKKKDELATI